MTASSFQAKCPRCGGEIYLIVIRSEVTEVVEYLPPIKCPHCECPITMLITHE